MTISPGALAIVDGAYATHGQPDVHVAVEPAGLLPPDVEAMFWEARPTLTHIRAFARARLASPWATLGVVLVQVLSQVTPDFVLPPLVGTHASLNTYLAIVGPSGAGKDAANGAARDAVITGAPPILPIGTGEGVVKSYVRYEVNPDTGEGALVQHETTAIFEVAEVDTLAALAGRRGSTLLPLLRNAWTGKTLGFTNSEAERRLRVDEHAYRLGLIVGVQPGRGRALLNDDEIAGGTPQRFLWLPATDPDAPDITPPEPKPLTWTMPDWPDGVWFGSLRHAFDVHPEVADTIRAARKARLRGEGEALDGHELLCREKVAIALALLEGHARLTVDDWELAGAVMDVSARTREGIERVLSASAASQNRAKADAEADRAVRVDDARAEAGVHRACDRIAEKLRRASGWVSRAELRRGLRVDLRPHFDEAIDRLVSVGMVSARTITESKRPGVEYRCTDGQS